MGSAAFKENTHYTYQDYLQWPDTERWEIIEGIAYSMSPAPSTRHQRISRELALIFCTFFKGKTCELFIAPFDVRFGSSPNAAEIDTVVQPDLSVVCNPAQIDAQGCLGAPELVIEITSPASGARDMKEKFALYEKYLVKEYWIVHPETMVVERFCVDENKQYGKPKMYCKTDRITTPLLPGLIVELEQVFGIK